MLLFFFAAPTRTHFVRKAHDWVRIPRPKIGERLAQQDILQAQGEGILAKGEIPVWVTQTQSYFLRHQTTSVIEPPYGNLIRRFAPPSPAGKAFLLPPSKFP